MKKEDLTPINASTFYEGMYINGDVYFNYGKSYVLLCRDVTITEALLAKFYQTELGMHELYVEKKYLDGIVALSAQFQTLHNERNETSPEVRVSAEEAEKISRMMALSLKVTLHEDYLDLRNRIGSVMDEIRSARKVPWKAADALKEEIATKIELTDPALLIECINNLRSPDDYLNAHAANVGMLNGMIGTWLDLPPGDVDTLIKTGLLHDIGKLRIPVDILNKPGPLTDEEFLEVKKHSMYSYEILKFSRETDNRILEGVLSHHERLNGSGYPSGIQVSQISLFARITAVSDVYDAMVAKRAYKDRHSPFDILAEFAFHKFSNLDIGIVNVFLDKLPMALVGKNVLLSDGRTGKVVYVNPYDFSYPIVEIDGKLLSTSPAFKCLAMENFLATVED
ncbi:MAG: HD-GYP domain-containing protein [Clostridiales bacterium]|nr:HD-GYP domain-containing protein [Clostridiales bacterium]